ncbi:MAG: rod shape-determining protein MreC [Ignavibacteriaceae bacterium]|nr:MAG: rod shape-determining protein MreC [Chlorobi bacterium OLB4]MBV6399371.1 hypothetical protein [Ignavibacteria bacterium]MBW7855724.1 rod shape-determining protein MreC [Ignavibacteria bacterium]MCC6886876.1 rod shape-determining protein MreC [Ignavibacteriales bacterium]MEB2330505.1 rod shape-determining protein MreC [Ignavibacteriaceae bacterium]
MKFFGEILFSIKEYLVLTLLVIVSLVLLFSNDNSQIRFIRALTIGTFGTIQSGFNVIPNVFDLESENKFLREKNIRLANELAEFKEAKLENIRLTKLLKLSQIPELDFISARIINKSMTHSRNSITLDRGKNEGIEIGMPIVTDDGLVGRVVSVSNNYSLGQILYNKSLKVSVKNQRSRVDGILEYDGSEKIMVSHVPKSSDVKQGDLFITSMYSNQFPRGIPVGIVIEEGNLDNMFKKIVLKPAVDFNLLEEVFVLKFIPDEERNSLENAYSEQQ